MRKIICIGILISGLCCGLAEAQTDGQTRIAKEERTRYVEDSLLAARLGISIERLRDSVRLMATRTYVMENYVTNTDSRLSDSRTPTGTAGGDLTGTYPNPSVKSSVNLTGSPTATTPATSTNSTRIATTAYVKNNLANYITSSDNRLTDSRTPTGTAGGDLTGTYPNPAIKSSVNLTGNPTVAGTLTVNGTGESLIKGNLRLKGAGAYGNKLNLGDGDYVYLYEATDDNLTIKAKNISLSPTASVTAPTPATTDNSTKVATTAYVKGNLSSYVTTSDSRLTDSRTPTGTAGGDLTGTYPNPTIKSSVNLTGSPTAPTPSTSTNSTRIATTAYVHNTNILDNPNIYYILFNNGNIISKSSNIISFNVYYNVSRRYYGFKLDKKVATNKLIVVATPMLKWLDYHSSGSDANPDVMYVSSSETYTDVIDINVERPMASSFCVFGFIIP